MFTCNCSSCCWQSFWCVMDGCYLPTPTPGCSSVSEILTHSFCSFFPSDLVSFFSPNLSAVIQVVPCVATSHLNCRCSHHCVRSFSSWLVPLPPEHFDVHLVAWYHWFLNQLFEIQVSGLLLLIDCSMDSS